MDEQRVVIVDLADELRIRKQAIFKILRRLGVQHAQRRESSRGNQNVATVTLSEAAAIRAALGRSRGLKPQADELMTDATIFYPDNVGVFYLIQLEPEHDPGRFKVGFTTKIEARLQKHRCAAPFAQCLQSWPCRQTWERAAIACVTSGCEQLHTEVFRAVSLENVAARAEAFFAIMPAPGGDSEEPENSEPS